MHRITASILLALALSWLAPPAAAADAGWSVRVIGFSKDGHVVVLRVAMDEFYTEHIDEDEITVQLYDLTRHETVKSYPIFEARNDSQEERKQRWNDCATELKGQGYTIDPDYKTTRSIPSLGVDLVTRRIEPEPEMPEYRIDLYVQKKGGEPVLIQEEIFFHEGSVMNPTSLGGFYLDPTGTYLFAFIDGGGGVGPVLKVTDIAAKLEQAAAKPIAPEKADGP